MGKLRWIVPAIGLLFLAGGAFAQQDDKKTPPLTVSFSVGWGGCYYPLEWTPVEIDIQNNRKEPVTCNVSITGQQDDLTTVQTKQHHVATSQGRLFVPMVVKMSGNATGKLLIQDGRKTLYEQDIGQTTALNSQDMLIGVVEGTRNASRSLRELERQVMFSGGRAYIRRKDAQQLPWDWAGYSGLSTLVMYDADISRLHPAQCQAIAQWVTSGGRLIVVLGNNPLPPDNPISRLIPLRLGSRADKAVTLRSNAAQTPIWELGELSSRLWFHQKEEGVTISAAGPAGFGHISVLAFDPAQRQDIDADTLSRDWIRLLNESDCLPQKLSMGSPDNNSPSHYYGAVDLGEVQRQTNTVLGHLMDIPQLQPLSIWWVIGLLSALALLLGPVDYIVLKKLDQLPRTWITSAGMIVLFTIGAYYGVRAIRAGDLQLQAVSVMDVIDGGPAWSTTYAGLFASDSDRYEVADPAASQWWSSISSENDYSYYHYQSSSSMLGRNLSCQQGDGRNLPEPMPVSIWTMQCLLREAPVAQPPVRAIVARSDNGLQLTLQGEKSLNIERCSMTVAGESYGFDAVSLGEPMTAYSTPTYASGYDVACHNAIRARGTDSRTQGLLAYQLDRKIAIVSICCRPELPFEIAGSKTTVNHMQLIRIVTEIKDIEQ